MFKDRKAFRDIIDLMLLSERHRDFYIKDLERLIFPAMETVPFYNAAKSPALAFSNDRKATDVSEYAGYTTGPTS